MALSTYAQLKSAIADWLERDDLSARTADFVTLAESRLNRVLRFRSQEVEVALTSTPGARTAPLPADFREPIALWLEGANGREPLAYSLAGLLPVTNQQGRPRRWTIDRTDITFERPCDQAYLFTLRMAERLALSDLRPANGVLADYPDLYLFGALVEAAPYLRDADLLSLFAARFDAALTEARAKESRTAALSRLAVEPELAIHGRRWGN